MQALFLIEAYAQYHGQRAPTQYSKYFSSVVNQVRVIRWRSTFFY